MTETHQMLAELAGHQRNIHIRRRNMKINYFNFSESIYRFVVQLIL